MSDFRYDPPSSPLEVLYQDDHLLALNKPAGLLSVPGRLPEHKDCLSSRAAADFGFLYVVHRLDMDTSGVILFARSKAAQSGLAKALQNRAIDKRYLALVEGYPEDNSGEIDLPLRCDWPNRPRQMVDHQAGKPSLTRWQILYGAKETSLLALEPVTGRSHQLRVHLAAIGHAIVGDRFYNDNSSVADRLMLHAAQLRFLHPITEQRVTIAACAGDPLFDSHDVCGACSSVG